MDKFILNLNAKATLALTELGVELLCAKLDEDMRLLSARKITAPLLDKVAAEKAEVIETKRATMQLWEVAKIFGDHLYTGAPGVLDMLVEVEVEDEVAAEISLLRGKLESLAEAYQRQEKEVSRLTAARAAAAEDGSWAWVGDGSDDLDSMSNSMVVTITGAQLRALVRDDRHRDEQRRELGEQAKWIQQMMGGVPVLPGESPSERLARAVRGFEASLAAEGGAQAVFEDGERRLSGMVDERDQWIERARRVEAELGELQAERERLTQQDAATRDALATALKPYGRPYGVAPAELVRRLTTERDKAKADLRTVAATVTELQSEREEIMALADAADSGAKGPVEAYKAALRLVEGWASQLMQQEVATGEGGEETPTDRRRRFDERAAAACVETPMVLVWAHWIEGEDNPGGRWDFDILELFNAQNQSARNALEDTSDLEEALVSARGHDTLVLASLSSEVEYDGAPVDETFMLTAVDWIVQDEEAHERLEAEGKLMPYTDEVKADAQAKLEELTVDMERVSELRGKLLLAEQRLQEKTSELEAARVELRAVEVAIGGAGTWHGDEDGVCDIPATARAAAASLRSLPIALGEVTQERDTARAELAQLRRVICDALPESFEGFAERPTNGLLTSLIEDRDNARAQRDELAAAVEVLRAERDHERRSASAHCEATKTVAGERDAAEKREAQAVDQHQEAVEELREVLQVFGWNGEWSSATPPAVELAQELRSVLDGRVSELTEEAEQVGDALAAGLAQLGIEAPAEAPDAIRLIVDRAELHVAGIVVTTANRIAVPTPGSLCNEAEMISATSNADSNAMATLQSEGFAALDRRGLFAFNRRGIEKALGVYCRLCEVLGFDDPLAELTRLSKATSFVERVRAEFARDHARHPGHYGGDPTDWDIPDLRLAVADTISGMRSRDELLVKERAEQAQRIAELEAAVAGIEVPIFGARSTPGHLVLDRDKARSQRDKMAEEMKAMVAERDDARAYASKLKSLNGKLTAQRNKLELELEGSPADLIEKKIIAACRSRRVRPPKDTSDPIAWVKMAISMRDENAHAAYTIRKALPLLDEARALQLDDSDEGTMIASLRHLIDDTNAQQKAVIEAGERVGVVGDDPADVAARMADMLVEVAAFVLTSWVGDLCAKLGLKP